MVDFEDEALSVRKGGGELDTDVDADERDSREGLVLFLKTWCRRARGRREEGALRPLVLFMMNAERPRPRLGDGSWEKGRWMNAVVVGSWMGRRWIGDEL